MAPVDTSIQDILSDREIEELLNPTQDGVDIFDTSNLRTETEEAKNQRLAGNVVELGVDEEVKIEKKRRPIPKLDEGRLLSEPGIPRLRKISKDRLKFKGKGYEYRDIARMLNMYQLWLDDLYPRAKFADGLTMIEKLGHSKRIQLMRKTWIDEGKPRHTTDHDRDFADSIEPQQSAQGTTEGMVPKNEQEEQEEEGRSQQSLPNSTRTDGDVPDDEDDLDALLAESGVLPTSTTSRNIPLRAAMEENDDDLFADEMEVIAEMEAMEAMKEAM